jgi:hypothetical protein
VRREVRRGRLVEQFHERHDVRLVLLGQDEESSRNEIEKLRVVRGHLLERLRGVVVEVRGRVPDAAQLRDLERVDVLERRRAVQDARDQRAPGIGAEDMRLVGVPSLKMNSLTGLFA